MRNGNRICLVGLLAWLCACRQSPPSRAVHQRQITITTQPASAPSAGASREPPSLLLRGALAPPTTQQNYRIELQFSAELHEASEIVRTDLMNFEIIGSLVPSPPAGSRDASLLMTIDRLRVHVEIVGSHATNRTFDFDSRNPGEPDALHRLVQPLAGASLRLWPTPTGELEQLRGVTQLTRDRRLTSPGELTSVVSLLNDAAFDMMVSHCLFPPLPSSPLQRTHQWQFQESSFPLDPCPLTATLIGSMAPPQEDPHGFPVAGLIATGTIRATIAECPLRLIDGRQEVWRHVSWNDHSLVQQLNRSMQFGPRGEPGENSSKATARYVRQERWISSRAGAATQTRPG